MTDKKGWGGKRANQTGRPKIDNPLVIISAAIPQELKVLIKLRAEREKTTASEVIRETLSEAMAREVPA